MAAAREAVDTRRRMTEGGRTAEAGQRTQMAEGRSALRVEPSPVRIRSSCFLLAQAGLAHARGLRREDWARSASILAGWCLTNRMGVVTESRGVFARTYKDCFGRNSTKTPRMTRRSSVDRSSLATSLHWTFETFPVDSGTSWEQNDL